MNLQEKMWAIVEAVAHADDEDSVSSLDVDIPKDGYPRQWLRAACLELLAQKKG